jgi:SAM-dependent methyltransferase
MSQLMCRVCDGKNLELVIDLGLQPWGNHFLKKEDIGLEPHYPLRVLYCHDCSTTQLDFTVKKEIMFSDHTYLSGVTKTLNDHFASVASLVDKTFFRDLTNKSVLDIGSNDGTQLQHYKKLGYRVLGVESSKRVAQIAGENGIETVNDFFNLELAKKINRRFHVINAAGVFFHLEELHSVTEGIRESLDKDGVFVVQFLYMKKIVENSAFDQIYHEHLLYYNLKNIEILLNQHGLSLFDAIFSPIHGGSIIGFVSHKGSRPASERLLRLLQEEELEKSNEVQTYHSFAQKIKEMKDVNVTYLQKSKKSGKTIFGFGAPVKGNTLLNYFGIGPDLLDCLVEKNPLRMGLYSPGMHLPIILEEEIKSNPDIYYVLAWNFKNEILQKNQHLINRGVEFFFPVNPNP